MSPNNAAAVKMLTAIAATRQSCHREIAKARMGDIHAAGGSGVLGKHLHEGSFVLAVRPKVNKGPLVPLPATNSLSKIGGMHVAMVLDPTLHSPYNELILSRLGGIMNPYGIFVRQEYFYFDPVHVNIFREELTSTTK